MGAWSTDSFGNDRALDWFGELAASEDVFGFIRQTLEAGPSEGVVAAGEILAFLRGRPDPTIPSDVEEWCRGKQMPSPELLELADKAIQRMLDDPKADVHDCWAELGEDDEDYQAWLSSLRGIQMRLR